MLSSACICAIRLSGDPCCSAAAVATASGADSGTAEALHSVNVYDCMPNIYCV
jgi:hypothetical protein